MDFQNHEMHAGSTFDFDAVVVGLGYVGLPLAKAMSLAGMTVVGLDVDPQKTRDLERGISHVADVSDSDLRGMISGGFIATTDEDVIARSGAVVIAVPTPLSDEGGPDLSAVRLAGQTVGRHLVRGQLVSLESTTYPGTTEQVLLPILESLSGLKVGTDFHLVFSPERVDPGNPHYSVSNTPKVVGGINLGSTMAALDFYHKFVGQVVQAKGTREAEMSKLLENTYRHINIALVNEMARFCHDMEIDIWDVIELAKTKPFGFQAFYPGPGVGGHCIPIDPSYLSHRVKAELGYPFRFVELAEEINRSMPRYVVERSQAILNAREIALNGSKVVIVGVAYKPDTSDIRESPAIEVVRQLRRHGAFVTYLDEYVELFMVDGTPVPNLTHESVSGQYDLGVILTAHAAMDYSQLSSIPVVLDARGVLHRDAMGMEVHFL